MAEQQNAKQQNAKEPDLNQLLKVRREKLAELQAAGKDPFQITKYDVTVHSEDVKVNYAEYEGKEVSVLFEEPVEVDGVRYFEGLTPEYVKVWVPTEENLTNRIMKVEFFPYLY